MDGSQFDHLTRALGVPRTRRAAATLIGTALVAPFAAGTDAKKRKRKKQCAKKCPDGCCTAKFGKCIQPAQQSSTRCGAGGAICNSAGCPECTANRPCPHGKCCKGDGTCGACLVFASSTVQNGNLRGLAGADAICESLAGNAGLPGTWMAWLSDNTGSPSTRFTRAATPYTLVDGTIIAANWNVLTSGTLTHAIDKSESGTSASSFPNQTWTGTRAAAVVYEGASCANWTDSSSSFGLLGQVTATNEDWTGYQLVSCNATRRIYCFQQR